MSKEVFDDYQFCNCCGKKFLLSCEVEDFIDGCANPYINEEIIDGVFCWKCIHKMEEVNDDNT